VILFTLQLNLPGVRNYVASSKQIFQEDKLKFRRFPVFPGAADTLTVNQSINQLINQSINQQPNQ